MGTGYGHTSGVDETMERRVDGQRGEGHAGAVFRQSVMTLGTRAGIVLVNVPTSILVARLLGPEGQGAYSSAVIFPAIFAFIGLLGVDASHTFLLSKRRYTVGQINGQSAILSVAMSAVTVACYLVFLALYPAAASPGLRSVLPLGAALIPVLLLKYLSVALLLGLQRIRWFNLANLIQAVTLLGFMCINLFVLRGGVRGALVAYLLSEVTVTLLALRVARRAVGAGPLFERPPPGMFRKSVIYGLQGHIGNILIQFTFHFDRFLILSMLGLQAQGLYSIAVILAEKLVHIPRSIQVVLFPKLSSLGEEEANRLTPRVLRNSLFLTAVVGLALYLLSRPLLLLFYGSEYLAALRAFQILIPGVVMVSVTAILSGDFSARDRRIYHTIANGIGFAANVVLCLVWIPRYGIEGAAWASTIAYALDGVLMLAFFRKLSGESLFSTVCIQRDDILLYRDLVRKYLGRRGVGS